MPIYEYRCGECEQIFEEWQTDYQEREIPCPVCGGRSKRLISNTSFVLKGTGWYTTDYARAGGKCSAAKEGSSESSSEGSSGDGGSKSSDSGASTTPSKDAGSSTSACAGNA